MTLREFAEFLLRQDDKLDLPICFISVSSIHSDDVMYVETECIGDTIHVSVNN
jgi:hypothetical protein